MKKRVLSLFLCLVMCLSMLPTSALADALDPAPADPEQEIVTSAQPVSYADDGEGEESENYVASYVDDDGAHYVTDLDDAFNDLMSAESEVTITLLKDATLDDSYTYSPLIINLNGFTITGDLTATESLTLNNGVIKGTLKVDCTDGSLLLTAPAGAEAAIDGGLEASAGSVSISGAKIGVKGSLYIDDDEPITISGTEAAVSLTSDPGPAKLKLYSNGVEATYENGTYTVNGEVATELTTVVPSGGETTPANLSISPENATIHPLGGSATFTVTYDGTDELDAYVQNSAVDSTIDASIAHTSGNTWALTVTTTSEVVPAIYKVIVQEAKNTFVSDIVEVTVSDHSYNADGVCTICNTSAFAMVTTADGATTFYDTFYEARNFAVLNDGCTLKLLQDYISYDTIEIFQSCRFTLDCTGHVFQPVLTIQSVADVKIAGGTFERGITATDRTLADIMSPGKTLVASSRYVDMSREHITGSVTVYDAPILEARILPHMPSTPTHYSESDQIQLEAHVKLQEGYTSGIVIQWYQVDGESYTPVGQFSMYYTPGKLDVGTHYFAFDVAYNGYVVRSAVISIQITTDPATYKSEPVAIENLTYNGKAQALVSGGETGDGTIMYRLGEDGEWSTDIPTGINAGTYTVYYKIEPDANHSGTNVSSLEVTIAKQPVTIQKVIIDNADNIVYTGRELEPAFTVLLSGINYLADTQYDVTYKDNINASDWALITITPKADGNYTFDAYTARFTIQKATITLKTDTYKLEDLIYTDKYAHSFRTNEAFFNTLFDVNSYPTAVETAYGFGITIKTGFVSAAYYSTLHSIQYRINPDGGDLSATPGQECSFELTIGFDNYNPIFIKCTLNTLDLPTPKISASDITVTYTGDPVPASAASATATVDGAEIPGTWSWKENAKPANVADSNTYVLVFTPEDTATYRSAEKEVKVTINPAKVSDAIVTLGESRTYNGRSQTVVIESVIVNSRSLTSDDYTIEGTATATDAGKYNIVLNGTGNYTDAYECQWEILKADPWIASWSPYIYTKCKFTGKQIENPTAENLPLNFGSFTDISQFNWYSATKNADNTYSKGAFLPEAPIDAGDYYIEAVFNEGTNTKAGIFGTFLTVTPNTDNQPVSPDAYTVYANRAYTYEVDLSSYLSDLRLGSNVTYQLVNASYFPTNFLQDAQSVTLSGTTLTIPMASKTNNPLPSTIYTLVIWVKSSNYNQITLSLPIQIDAKPTKELDVTMPNWTFGTMGTATYYISGTKETPEGEVKLSYFDADGVLLQKAYPTEVGKYSVQVRVETDTTIYVGTAYFKIVPKDINNVTITLKSLQLVYNGSSQTKLISSVIDNDVRLWLDEGRHYEIVEGTNVGTDAGTYTMTIRGMGNYTGEATIDWTIARKTLTNPRIVIENCVYNGKPQTPAVKIYDDEIAADTPISDTEYSVTYDNNTDATTMAEAIITTKDGGNYIIEKTRYFTIEKAMLPGDYLTEYALNSRIYTDQETHSVNVIDYWDELKFPVQPNSLIDVSETSGHIHAEPASSFLKFNLTDGAFAGETCTIKVKYYFANYQSVDVTFTISVLDRATPTVTANNIVTTYTGRSVSADLITGTATVNDRNIPGTWSWANGVTPPKSVSSSTQYEVTFTPDDEANYKPVNAFVKVTVNPFPIAGAKITLDSTQLVYNRTEQEQKISEVSVGESGQFKLTLGDFYISGNKATDAGTHTLTLTAVTGSNFTGTASIDWTISPKELDNPTIVVAGGSTYNGKQQTPAVTVYDGEAIEANLIPATEYTVEYGKNVDAGTAAGTLSLADVKDGNYILSGSATFDIAKAALPDNFVYEYTLPALIYNNRKTHTSIVNGSAYASAFHFPQNALPSVVLGEVTGNIKVDAEYSNLSYTLTDEAAAGDVYTFKLTYQFPDYVDATVTFKLPVIDRAKPVATPDEITMVYTGSAVPAEEITGTAKVGDETIPGTWTWADSVIAPTNVSESGEYNVTFTPAEIDKYYPVSAKVKVTITPVSIAGAVITLDGTQLIYNRAEQEKGITAVKAGAFTLTADDYTVTGNHATDAGTHTITLNGEGNFTGKASIDWTIAPKVLNTPTIVVASGSTYNSKQQTPAVTIYDGKAIAENMIPAAEYTVEYGENIKAGKDAGTITLKDNANGNYTVSGSATFDIAKATAGDKTYDLPAQLYTDNGEHALQLRELYSLLPETPTSVTAGSTSDFALAISSDQSTLTYNLLAGAKPNTTYNIPLSFEFANYNKVNVTLHLTTLDKSTPSATPDEITMIYNGSAVPAEKITGTAKVGEADISGTWSWANGVTAPTNVSQSGEYDVTFTPSEDSKYYPVTTKVKVTITPASITGALITLDSTQLIYNRAQQEKVITSVKAAELVLTADDYTVTGNKATDADTYTLTLTGKGNFKDSTSTTWTIVPKLITNPTIEIAPGSTYDGSAQKPAVTVKDGGDVIPASEYTVSYSSNVNAGEDTATVTITDNANGNYTVSGSAAFSIAKAAHTITASDVTAVYGQTDCVIQPTGTLGDVSYAVKSGADVASVDENGTLRLLKSGTAVITVSDTGDGNHLAAALDVSVTVSKANVTITAMDKSAFTGDKAPDLSNPKDGEDYTVSGLIGEDTLDVTVVLSYDETPNMNKTGTCAIIPSVSGEDARYSFTFENGTLEIKQRPVSPLPTYPVTVAPDENGETSSSVSVALKGQTVTITTKPESGYALSTVFVTDADGRQLPLTDLGNGRFSFTMPASKVTVRATYRKLQSTSFKDVLPGAYYYDAVQWAVDGGITTGIGNDLFDPNGICTRAQIVTFLWRAAGCPEPKTTVNPFNDVKPGDYYYKAVLWAVENGITKGIAAGQFRPNDSCTRAQAVTFLFRAFGTKTDAVSAFRDVSQNAYYASAVNWAVKNGVTNGTAPALFSPDTPCTRAQIVTFLYRAFKTR